MDELEKQEFLGNLFAYYGQLLTPVQQGYFTDYYYNDLSLAEIAENNHVSRQAVYDNLKRCRKTLIHYESLLHLKQIEKETGQHIETVLALLHEKDHQGAVRELQTWLQKLNHE